MLNFFFSDFLARADLFDLVLVPFTTTQNFPGMRKLFTFGCILLLSHLGFGQWTYGTSFFQDAGNPGGINPETSDATTTGWTQLITGPQATNSWSPVATIPFPFNFYGSPVTQFKASQNGLVTFDVATTILPNANEPLPSVNLPDSTVAVLWDEFTIAPPTGAGDNIITQTFGTAPNRQFWIKWFSFEIGNPVISFAYFALVLEETTNKMYAVDLYNTTAAATSATVGVQLNNTTAVMAASNYATTGNGSTPPDNDYVEFTPVLLVNDDAGIANLLNPVNPLTAGVQNVDITLQNFGINTLNAANIDWEINGVPQTGVAYTTPPLAPGASTPLTLGSFNFPAGTTTIKAWTSSPNGTTDNNNLNDTIDVFLCTGLAGTYTIGTGGDFLTFAEVVIALEDCGINGPVVFNILPGTYNENLFLEPILGASATNTVTFNGGDPALATLTWNGQGGIGTITLAGADYVTIKNLTIENTGTTDAWGVHLRDTANWNTIDSCIITMTVNPGGFDIQGVVATGSNTSSFTEAQNCNYTTISHNLFLGGEMAIHLEGQNANRTAGNRILYNTISGPDDYGIYLDDQDSVQIIGNTITGLVNIQSDGIYCFDLVDFIINENNVYARDYGIYVADGNFDGPATLGPSQIINNMVYSETDYAIYLADADFIQVYHNSAWGNPGFRIGNFTNIDVRNNIFASTSDFAFEADQEFTFSALDFNIYFTPATNPNFVDFGPTTYADLASWQTAFPTININSLEGDPGFIAPTDLHIAGGFGNDLGDNTVGITVDIDGETRPQAPSTVVDMGADEFTPSGRDIGAFAVLGPQSGCGLSDSSLITVEVRSFGIDTIFSFNISFQVGTGTVTTETVMDTLLPSGVLIYTFTGTADLSTPGATYLINSWTTLVNDGNIANDSTLGYSVTHELPVSSLPYVEDFETFTVGNPGVTGNGWTVTNSNASAGWHVEDASGTDENSTLTGPFYDNTFFNQVGGIYLFTETSSGVAGDRYELISPCIDLGAATNLTFEFAYHMWGATMGSLLAEIQVQGTWITLANIVGEQQVAGTDPWLISSHNISAYAGEVVRIRIVGIRGTSFTSDMAVDDIRIFEPLPFNGGVAEIVSPISGCGLSATDSVEVLVCNAGFDTLMPGYSVSYIFNGGAPVTETFTDTLLPDSCKVFTFTTPINAGTPATSYTLDAWTSGITGDSDASNDSTIGYTFFHRPAVTTFPYIQDFENGGVIPVEWENVTDDGPQDWQFRTGSTPTTGTGPTGDHTTGNGYYAYVEDNSGNNDSVILVTPCFDLTGLTNGAEFSFWYHSNEINGGVIPADVNELHIDLFYQGDWIQDIILPIEHKNNSWNPQSINLASYPGVVALRFRVNNRNGSGNHDIAIDDIQLTELLPQDAGVVAINSPTSDCGLSATEPFEIDLRNFGTDSIFSVDVVYTINGGTPTIVTITDTIEPQTIQSYVIGTLNLSVPNDYTITAYTVLTGDTNNIFDTTTVMITSIPNVSTYPYFEDFESGTGGWRVVDDNGVSTWELATPAGTVINSAFSGVNSWVTNATGTYSPDDNSAVVGPCFDFSTLVLPTIELAIWYDAEFSWDGAVLQSSTDSGATWINVGGLGDPNNWYTDGTLLGNPGGQQIGWSGTGTSGSGGWLIAENSLASLAGEPDVQLRVAFGSDGSVVDDGFAFDNILIKDTPANDLGVAAQINPPSFDCGDTAAVVEVMIVNYGIAPQSNVPVTVNVGGAGSGTITATFPGPIAVGDTATFVVGSINTSAGGNYTFTSYTSLTGDSEAGNDTTISASSIQLIPDDPFVFNDSSCVADSLLMLVANSPTSVIAWYDSSAGGAPIAIGDTFFTSFLSTTTTYYAQAGWSPSDSLSTTFAGGNGQSGNMFDVTNNLAVPIILDSIDQHIGSTGAETVEIWYVTGGGTYVGNETNAAAWTLLGTANVTAAGVGNPTHVPVGGLVIPPGQTYGLYVTVQTTNIDYTTLTANTSYTNGQITIDVGIGNSYQFGGTFSPRGWNGRLYYSGALCTSDRVPVQAVINAAPPVSLGPDAIACAGFPIDATTPGVVSYLWSTGETSATINADLSGTYYVDVVDINGCTGSDTINMTILPSPTVDLGPDVTGCGTATLDAGNPGATYVWQDGSVGQTFEATASGTYFVNVTLSGCSDTDTINVTVLPEPSVDLGPDLAVCDDVTLDAGNPGSTYLWSTGETTQSITVTTPTAQQTISVTVTNADGCTETDDIILDPGTPPVIDLPASLSACGDTILDAGNPGATYLWSNGEMTQSIVVDVAGTYSVTVIDAFGCENTASVDVTISPEPEVDITFSNVGFTYTFLSTNIPGATYEWSFGDGSSVSTDPNPVFTYLFPGAYTVVLTVTNDCGTATDSINIGNVSIEDDLFASQIFVSPNPTSGKFFVVGDKVQAEVLTLEVSDMRGRIIYSANKERVNGFREAIDITQEAEGVYMLRVSDGERNAYIRILRE